MNPENYKMEDNAATFLPHNWKEVGKWQPRQSSPYQSTDVCTAARRRERHHHCWGE